MPDDLTRAYTPRLAEFVSDERYGDWRFKLYGLADQLGEHRLDGRHHREPHPPAFCRRAVTPVRRFP